MWKTAFKFLLILFVKNRMEFAKNNFFNKLNTDSGDDFNQLKENVAVMAESRAAIFKQNFNQEVRRVVNSLFYFMLILIATFCAGLTGVMWLFATAWTSPHRETILGTTMVLPILIAIGIYVYVRYSWHKEPLFNQSIVQIENDWQVFRGGLDGTADTSDEANR